MEDPRSTTPQSIMPAYPWLSRARINWTAVERGVAAQAALGVPYTPDEVAGAAALGRRQAQQIAAAIAQQGGPAGLEDTQLVALVAYLQRLGTDIKATPKVAAAPGGGEGAGR
jgi:cytochrome c oxidase cbb3-type subunit I/II